MGMCDYFNETIDVKQIRVLIWKDFLIKTRQPWMTLIQFLWPCVVFLSLYALRIRFNPTNIGECQFPTRQLPSKTDVLPFFQSYICTIDNSCLSPKEYEETSRFTKAPVTPVLNILQTFVNDDLLFDAVVGLPDHMNFLKTVTTVASSPHFSYLEENVNIVHRNFHIYLNQLNGSFDATTIWSDATSFSKFGTILCGQPFSYEKNVRFIERAFYEEDYNGPDKDELNAMPTKYCKQLYLDVTTTNKGKITWNQVKPVIQGKILYGPNTTEVRDIISYAGGMFEGLERFQIFISSLDKILRLLRAGGEFKAKFNSFIALAKSPIVSSLIKSFSIDPSMIDSVLNTLINDENLKDIVKTTSDILQCFSVDRFIPVESEKDLEIQAFNLNDKKLFYGGIYFNISNHTLNKEYTYTIRMDIDNTPKTIENRNRFWFPGPAGSFAEDHRYHRGFIEFQHVIDQAIIKKVKTEKLNKKNKEKGVDIVETAPIINETTTTTPVPTTTNIPDSTDFYEHFNQSYFTNHESRIDPLRNHENLSLHPSVDPNANPLWDLLANTYGGIEGDEAEENQSAIEDFLNFKDQEPKVTTDHSRKKRAPQFDGLFSLFLGDKQAPEETDQKTVKFKVDDLHVFTKQFPYPKYNYDGFKIGIYLSQGVQISFFVALIIQVASIVRSRIWLRESGNFMLMQVMGLKRTSEFLAWFTTSIIEILIIFFLCVTIMYIGGLLEHTSQFFLAYFLFLFAIAVVSFCYMVSQFYTTASIGCASIVILFPLTFAPYIVIIALGKALSFPLKLIASFSLSTPFCYAWEMLIRTELQGKEFTFSDSNQGSIQTNEVKFSIFMILIDALIYFAIGYIRGNYKRKQTEFNEVFLKDMEPDVGATLEDVSKRYDDGKMAVENVSIVFRRDFVTCLLGRNGTGKSTLIKLLTGQIAPTSGDVYWPMNLDRITGNTRRDQIGLCPQGSVVIPNLTAKEHLELYAALKLNENQKAEVNRIMRNLDFGVHEDFMVENLSGGFKRRLNVAIAFVGSPNLVILDEPCSGVDTKARRTIWDLIGILKQGRAVVLATHYLDEAEHLSDNVLIFNEGKIISENNPDSLRSQFTKSCDIHITLTDLVDSEKVIDEIKNILEKYSSKFEIVVINGIQLSVSFPYLNDEGHIINFSPMIESIEKLQSSKKILKFRVQSKDLEGIFNEINHKIEADADAILNNGHGDVNGFKKEEQVEDDEKKLSEFVLIKMLLWKRFMHFSRNYRMIICILLLPLIFEIAAMGFMIIRSPDEYGTALKFSKDLYSNSTEFYSLERETKFTKKVFDNFHCKGDCKFFNTSEQAFHWLLNTYDHYRQTRYGGISLNHTMNAVWYNNKGFHAMPVYLNELNTAIFQATMNDNQYKISTINQPIKLGRVELSSSSILQQAADAGISIILLLAFSYVIAGCSIYTINERINGEKLQQKLAGVSFRTYWGVSFFWDLCLYSVALLLAIIVIAIFNLPVFTERENLSGIVFLLFMFGFATIPMVHLCEKLFTDSSLAAMHILCMNVVIALSTLTTIILFDVLGNSDESIQVQNFLNRLFLVFPQHALSDGLLKACRNHITAKMFERYYVNTYKSPVYSDLLRPNLIALLIFGVLFMVLNYVIESNLAYNLIDKLFKRKDEGNELEYIDAVPNSCAKDNDKYDLYNPSSVLNVRHLGKVYKGNHPALEDICFQIKKGECFGLLGSNGAGKSTIFSILSGELRQSSGTVEFLCPNGISYCPQSNALDNLLTVKEIIQFYGTLRKMDNLDDIISKTLQSYHLVPYQDILVKNLSGGNRRKLSVAVACFGKTDLILMDEPTSDMDPVTRSLVYKSINELIHKQRSVILTSHTITEIDRICQRIGVIKEGKMIMIGTLNSLKTMFGSSYLVTIFFNNSDAINIERDIKKEIPDLDHLIIHNHCLQFTVKIKSDDSEISTQNTEEDRLHLSQLFEKLNNFSSDRCINYTVSECQLNQAIERVLESDSFNAGYSNTAFVNTESST